MGARMGDILKRELEIPIDDMIYWTDSKTVLNWINSEAKRFKTFVAQHLGEIQELTNIKKWEYVKSTDNVADEATKMSKNKEFFEKSRWINGPHFLKLPSEKWEDTNIKNDCLEDMEEIKINYVGKINLINNLSLPDYTRFSKWSKLLRTTGWIVRILNICKKRHQNLKNYELHPEEIQQAENLLYRQIQMDSFSSEILHIKNSEKIPKTSQ